MKMLGRRLLRPTEPHGVDTASPGTTKRDWPGQLIGKKCPVTLGRTCGGL